MLFAIIAQNATGPRLASREFLMRIETTQSDTLPSFSFVGRVGRVYLGMKVYVVRRRPGLVRGVRSHIVVLEDRYELWGERRFSRAIL